MSSSNAQRGAVVAMVVTILIWAYSWVVMKQVLQHAGPFQFSALRYVLGALVLFVALLVTRQPLKPPPLWLTAVIGLCQTAAFQGLGQLALVSGGAGRIALLAYTMPFWAVLLAWAVLGERPTRRHWTGLFLAALGLVCIIAPWRGLGTGTSTLLAIVAGFFWALGTVLSKKMFMQHRPTPLNLTAWQMAFGSLALCVLAVCIPQRPFEWTWGLIGGLAYSVLLASSLAWGLWLLVLQRLPTAIASLSSLGVPIVSVVLAWMILGERPGATDFIGMAFIALGLVAVSGVRLGALARARG